MRIRTSNLLIRSQMLYPLSYGCIFLLLLARFGPKRADNTPGHPTKSRPDLRGVAKIPLGGVKTYLTISNYLDFVSNLA